MKYARKIIITDSVSYEVGTPYKDQGVIESIKIAYPLARVFVKNNALPVVETFLQRGSCIEWIPE